MKANALQTSADSGRFLLFNPPPTARKWKLLGFDCVEEISSLFRATLTLELPARETGGGESLLRQPVGFGVRSGGKTERWFHGVIHRVTRTHEPHIMLAEVAPDILRFQHFVGSRVFARKSTREIVDLLLAERNYADYEWRLEESGPIHELRIQYRESTFNFISRLLEQEGISFYFEHRQDGHRLVMTDMPGANSSDEPHIPFRPDSVGDGFEGETVHSWIPSQTLLPAQFTCKNCSPESPSSPMILAESTGQENGPAPDADGDVYDLSHCDDPQQGKRYLRFLVEAERARNSCVAGSGNVRSFQPGTLFQFAAGRVTSDRFIETLTLDPLSAQLSYLLTAVEHHAREATPHQPAFYSNSFLCLPETIPYRPARKTPQPIIPGFISARVASPEFVSGCEHDSEILVDKSARVPVHFHFERQPGNENVAWIAVGQAWAGRGFGALFLPRSGQEVLVAFENGYPDRPVIISSVYARHQLLPFPCADAPTVTGFRSHSSPGAGLSHGNSLTFDDAVGHEQIQLLGERDVEVASGHDLAIVAQNDAHETVGDSKFSCIEKDRHECVGGDVVERVEKDVHLLVGGTYALSSTKAAEIRCGNSVLQISPARILLQCGASTLELSPAGIRINGPLIKLNCAGATEPVKPGNLTPPKRPKPSAKPRAKRNK